jgi:UDP-N-acetylmuramate dehydrogenase
MVRGRLELNVLMSERTTMRTGGPADLMIRPADRDDLAAVLRFLHSREIETVVIGNGSSVIVRDGGIRGATIQLAEGFDSIKHLESPPDTPKIQVDAGVSLRRLVRWTVDEGIGGLEYLYGIPGAVGGAVMSNTGAWGHDFATYVVEVETMDREGEIHRLSNKEIRFSYRRTQIPANHVVISATLQGVQREAELVKKTLQDFHDRRRSIHPIHEPSAGMVFFNPAGETTAGQMIDRCGLKGIRVGEAEISRLHANFIVNLGHAQATQIVSLIGMIQERVYMRNKIRLEPKVKVIGSWQKDKLRIRE